MFRCTARHSESDHAYIGEGETKAKAKAAAKVMLYADCYDPEFCTKTEVLSFTKFETVAI